MTDHGLKIGTIVDLDIGRGGSAGGFESDGGTWGDAGEETAFVPRRLPLEIASLVNVADETQERGGLCNVPHPRYSATRQAEPR